MSDVTGSSLTGGGATQGANKVFSLQENDSLLSLLRHIHQSPLQPDEKNELRDVLFTFASSKDSQVTPQMLKLFSEYGFTLASRQDTAKVPRDETKEEAPVITKKIGFGGPRPQPSFVPSTPMGEVPAAQTVVESLKDIDISKIEEEKSEQPLVVPEIPTENTKKYTSKIEPTLVSIPKPDDIPEEEKEDVSTPSNPEINLQPSERIKEIKKEVNALVGNPVNLIDVHNEVGREYMNALLDAMKKNNGGSHEEVMDAMNRLEKSFTDVKDAVGLQSVPLEQTPKPEPKNVNADENTVEKVPTPAKTTPTQDETVVPIPPPVHEVLSDEKETPLQNPAVSGFASVLDTHVVTETKTPVHTIPGIPNSPAVASPSSEVPTPPAVPNMSALPTVPAPPQADTVVPSVQEDSGMMSVAKQKQIQDLMTAKKQEAATTDKQKEEASLASLDPLMRPEVTNGLQQLLSEWSLFKSSGIFGTGPSGIEHPLYKKLSSINMTAVVAGRYEGATPQIKRSITDYMNGWRYEEGILQEQGELFEHYLRRVIKHILGKRDK